MKCKCVEDQKVEAAQQRTCERYGAAFQAACDFINSGFALETEGRLPINGLRHPATLDTTGWYLWCGETFSEDKDFFRPVHTIHIYEKYPMVADLLGLPPGYRFLIAGSYTDVWFDPELLQV